ncbi:MAG: T9SS type A sorting domain-containing protein [Flavobacteriales bacterium]|nr:T9SS type A sorting domain-containing protein [Flavobacteriales bacterium]
MKNSILVVAAIVASIFTTQAQNAHCGFDQHLEKMLAKDPSGMNAILQVKEQALEAKHQRLVGDFERGSGGPRIIPTVFHIIHQGGSENISMAQIQDQMRILNEDFSRTNADAANTRPEFEAVAANPNIEFRLAKLDPQGNCTDGVVRVWSPKTFNASDDNGVKAVSYWNSTKYFNVWVVATIDNDGEAGTILGYAQFPGFGGAASDGVVVRADYVGSIGTGASNNSAGRTLTHEAGHWLGLFHTFQGGCDGGFFDDACDDTPPQAEATPSNCPLGVNTCTNDSPDLPDQVENYMDYSYGACQNMYTLDQKSRFDGVLSGTRSAIHSGSNLTATGVLLGETLCAPIADFYATKRVVCAGDNITLTDNTFNGVPSSYDWALTGATPNTSSSANPTVVYNTPGVYSITLNVSNATGADSHTITDYVTVISGTAVTTGWIGFEGFEETNEDYLILSDGQGNTWQETATAFTGNSAIVLNNFSGNPLGSEDEFQLPSVDLTGMNNPRIYFRLSYKERSGKSDQLRIYISRDCGENWSLRYTKNGSSLATVSGTQGSPFTPSSTSDWEQVDVNLSTFANDEHVLIKFRGTSGEGNNIYIDDIQISGPLGVVDSQSDFAFRVSPNPMTEQAQINLEVVNAGNYNVSICDVTGKLISTVHAGTLSFGNHRFDVSKEQLPSTGIYLIQVDNGQGRSLKKLVVQ